MGDGVFIGREAELQSMESILQLQSNSLVSIRKVLILGGMGGIGKTQLAISYAKRHRHSYSSVFWLNANNETTLQNSIRVVAMRIFPPETIGRLEDYQVWVYISNWLSKPDNTQWLLIFDNYDEPDQYRIEEYYPSVGQGSMIITTRRPEQVNGEKIKLGSMTLESDGLAILATRSKRSNVESGNRHLILLIDWCLLNTKQILERTN